jgi:hypothetical protein
MLIAGALVGLLGVPPRLYGNELSLRLGLRKTASGLLAVAEPWQRGTTVAVYSCIGFAGGFIGTLSFGLSLDWLGGTVRLVAWVMAFGICAVACLIGAIATAFLLRDLGRASEK